MNVTAYCAKAFEASTRRAAGVQPHTCPPHEEPDTPSLDGSDFLYIALHGDMWTPQWYGDHNRIALRVETLSNTDLDGAVVFAEACYLPDTPMLAAALRAGARAVIGGDRENWGGADRLTGTSLLGWAFRVFSEKGAPPALALRMAKFLAFMEPGGRRDDIAGFRLFGAAA